MGTGRKQEVRQLSRRKSLARCSQPAWLVLACPMSRRRSVEKNEHLCFTGAKMLSPLLIQSRQTTFGTSTPSWPLDYPFSDCRGWALKMSKQWILSHTGPCPFNTSAQKPIQSYHASNHCNDGGAQWSLRWSPWKQALSVHAIECLCYFSIDLNSCEGFDLCGDCYLSTKALIQDESPARAQRHVICQIKLQIIRADEKLVTHLKGYYVW